MSSFNLPGPINWEAGIYEPFQLLRLFRGKRHMHGAESLNQCSFDLVKLGQCLGSYAQVPQPEQGHGRVHLVHNCSALQFAVPHGHNVYVHNGCLEVNMCGPQT